jgi:aspartyl-tRNA synthetase
MKFGNITHLTRDKGFTIFDSAEIVAGFSIKNGTSLSRKDIDNWISWIKQPQIGAKGMVWVRYNEDQSLKSSVDKFYTEKDLIEWAKITGANPGDLIFILSGKMKQTLRQLGELRIAVAEKIGLRDPEIFAPLWVTDFPLLEWDEELKRFHAIHHPFTSPKKDDLELLEKFPDKVRANAYDLVLNGNEIGGGSIRIHNSKLQKKIFSLLGFSDQEAQSQFGFLMGAFKYGAPPHGGIAFGLDRLVAILGGKETIRDFIAFPKNNSGRDVMIDSPSLVEESQLKELNLGLKKK